MHLNNYSSHDLAKEGCAWDLVILSSMPRRNPYLGKGDQRVTYLCNSPSLRVLLHEEGTQLIFRVSVGKRTGFIRFHLSGIPRIIKTREAEGGMVVVKGW